MRIKSRQRDQKTRKQRENQRVRLARSFQEFIIDAVESVTGEDIR